MFDQPHGRRDVIVGGTGDHAGRRVGTVDAAGRLHHGPLGAELDDNCLEITDPLLGRPLFQVKERHICPGSAIDRKKLTGYGLHGSLQIGDRYLNSIILKTGERL